MPLINSKLDVRRSTPETRKHDRKKLKVLMIDKVIHYSQKGRQKVSLSHINREKPHRRGDLWIGLFPILFSGTYFGSKDFILSQIVELLPFRNETTYLEEQLAT